MKFWLDSPEIWLYCSSKNLSLIAIKIGTDFALNHANTSTTVVSLTMTPWMVLLCKYVIGISEIGANDKVITHVEKAKLELV